MTYTHYWRKYKIKGKAEQAGFYFRIGQYPALNEIEALRLVNQWNAQQSDYIYWL